MPKGVGGPRWQQLLLHAESDGRVDEATDELVPNVLHWVILPKVLPYRQAHLPSHSALQKQAGRTQIYMQVGVHTGLRGANG